MADITFNSELRKTTDTRVTAKVLACALGMSESWVRKSVWRKTIPFLKCGTACRFSIAEVEAALRDAERTKQGGAQ